MSGRWLWKLVNIPFSDFTIAGTQFQYKQNLSLYSDQNIQNYVRLQIRHFGRKSSKSPVAKLPRDQLPVVAITGRPNVGKSSLFNRLLKRRDALVYNTPGSHVTRDYKEGIGHFADLKFKVIDTSGLEPFMPKDSIQFRATRLTEKVINKSDVVILVIDARAGLALLDQHLGSWLQQHSKSPIILVANKCEHYTTDIESTLYESTVLGMGMPVPISAESGMGFSDLYSALRPIIDDIAMQRLQKIKTQETTSKLQIEKEILASQQFLQRGSVLFPQEGAIQDIENPEAYIAESEILHPQLEAGGEKILEDGKEVQIGEDSGRRGMLELEMGIDAEFANYQEKTPNQQVKSEDVQYAQHVHYEESTNQQKHQVISEDVQYVHYEEATNHAQNAQNLQPLEDMKLKKYEDVYYAQHVHYEKSTNQAQNSQNLQSTENTTLEKHEEHIQQENQQNPQDIFDQYKQFGLREDHAKYVQHVDDEDAENAQNKFGDEQDSEFVVLDENLNDKQIELQLEHTQEIQAEIDQQRQRNASIDLAKQQILQQLDEGVQNVKITSGLEWDSEMQQIYEESEDAGDTIMKHFTEVESEKIKIEDGEIEEDDEEDEEEEEEELDEILEEDAEKIHRLVSDGWVDPYAQKEEETSRQIEAEEGEEAAQKHITLASNYVRIAIVGLPNVGKSTMVNQLLGEERCLTGPEPGLTRDSILSSFSHQDYQIDLIDTAGYMKRTKLDQFDDVGGRVAQLTLFQGQRAVNMAHVVIIIIDGYETYVSRGGKPLSAKEIRLVANVFEEGRGLVIVANKMDLLSSRQRELIRRELCQQVEEQFHQVKGVPVVFTSALTGDGLQGLMPAVVEVFKNWTQRISTARVNRWMQKLKVTYVGTGQGSGVPKVRYLTQVKARPPTFVVMFKRFNKVGEDDTRHVRNVVREAFGFEGVPVRVYARDNRAEQLRRKFKGYKGKARQNLVQRLKEQKRSYLLKDKEFVQELIRRKQEHKRQPWLSKKKQAEQQKQGESKEKSDDLKGKHKAKYDKMMRYKKLASVARS